MEVLSHYELAHYFLPLSNLFDHKFILHFVFVALLSLYGFLTHSKPHDQIKILEFIPHIAFPPLSFTLFSYYEQFTIFGNYLESVVPFQHSLTSKYSLSSYDNDP